MKKLKSSLIVFLIVLSLGLGSSCFALKLEVEYPQLPSGETLSPEPLLPEYIKYIFNFGMSIGFLVVFLSLIYGGFRYITSAGRPEIIGDAKARIFAGISGMVLLVTVYLIITTINPQLRFLTIGEPTIIPGMYLIEEPPGRRESCTFGVLDVSKLDSRLTHIEYRCITPDDPPYLIYFYNEPRWKNLYKTEEIECGEKKPIEGESFKLGREPQGVYLYKNSSCAISSEEPAFYASGASDLGELKNKINSVRIVNDPPDYIWYVSILYDMINWQGKCEWINPYADCENVEPFASSISVYRYYADPADEGDVTFYRKSFFNESLPLERQEEGTFKIEHSDLFPDGYFFYYLDDLKFENESGICNVPIEERDCVEWNLKGNCIQRECPNLTGENISSIKINGEYFVILLYYRLIDPSTGEDEWIHCQAFPTPDDVEKEGPKQIKWEYVRNKGKYPNAVLILPVKY